MVPTAAFILAFYLTSYLCNTYIILRHTTWHFISHIWSQSICHFLGLHSIWHFFQHISICTIIYVQIYIWQVFWHSLIFYLTCIQFFIRILSETWYSIWHCIWHILWHSIWNSISTLFDKYSDIPFGIYCEFLLRSYWHSIWHFVWRGSGLSRHREPEISPQCSVPARPHHRVAPCSMNSWSTNMLQIPLKRQLPAPKWCK